MNEQDEILDLWFGTLDAGGRADAGHSARWWKKDEAFDEMLRARFGALHEAVVRGERDAWLDTPRGRLAYVIVLDQLSRNMFRGGARMFAADARALEVAEDGIDRGEDRELALAERGFLYMPLEHSEDLADQERCVALISAWRDEVAEADRGYVETLLDYAERHAVIIRRFGRFPHRNALLDRTSTAEEIAFLKEPGSSF